MKDLYEVVITIVFAESFSSAVEYLRTLGFDDPYSQVRGALKIYRGDFT